MNPPADPPIAVVVVNYGSHALLADTLALGPDEFRRVVVVDNFSSAAERTALAALGAERGWDLVLNDDNRGFGAAVNLGAARARALGCGSIVLVNPDAVADGEVVEQLRQHVRREPGELVSPRIVDSSGADFFRGAWLHLRDGRIRGRRPGESDVPGPGRIAWLSGAFLACGLDAFDRIGGFDTGYFLYWEDVDLSYRALRAGCTLSRRDDLVVVHDEGGTQTPTRGRAKSDLYYRWNTRNRLLFAARHLGRRDLLRWMLTTPAVSREILLRGGRRQLVQSPRPLWAALRGSVAGLGLALRAVVRR